MQKEVLKAISLLMGSVCTYAMPDFDIQGHRGARGLLPPGNTLPSYQMGIDAGADTLEGDMQITRDGVVIMNHDNTVTASCVWTGKSAEPDRTIKNLDYHTITQFNCHPELDGHFPPPTTQELVALAEHALSHKGAPIQLSLEMKQGDKQSVHQYLNNLQKINDNCDQCLDNRLIIQCFDWDACKQAKIENHDKLKFRTSFLTEYFQQDFHNYLPYIDILSPYEKLVSSSLIQETKKFHIAVIPWTVNDPNRIQALKKMGVAGIITDYPYIPKDLRIHSLIG